MNQISLLTSEPKQELALIFPDGSRSKIKIWYSETQQGWFFNLDWGTFSLRGRRLVASPNVLRAFRDIIPFGLACFTKDGYEPIYRNDFSSGRASVYILDEDDIVDAETGIAAYE